ncbi:MAG: TerB family tellurite resistance protein [Acidobacteria bacterium]|nr:TerB family tellurite resistance protein [Acidobacteriota bacterium]MCG3192541.1 hypothetical protein [Thermoanaerobaculia bacterium]MCK6682880.1 TerB family tellurite resistance protein [Thermoanaerobaculia bacterium]
MDTVPEVELNDSQAAAIARIMLAVAQSDGEVDDRELSLIGELAPADLTSPVPDPSTVAALFPEPSQKELLVRSALLVALVDRSFSAAERSVVEGYAKAFGMGEEDLERLASDVKAFLMSPLIGLSNSESVAEVSKNLKI